MPAHRAPTRCRIATPFQRDLLIVGNGEAVVASRFVTQSRGAALEATDALLAEATAQARAYFGRRLRRFDLPLLLDGTAFRVAVWRAVAQLSFGEFVSYAEVAAAIGRPLAHRGVAAAMALTPIDLFIPAHRVIGADGRIKGAGPRSVRFRLAEFEVGRRARRPRIRRSRAFLRRSEPDRR